MQNQLKNEVPGATRRLSRLQQDCLAAVSGASVGQWLARSVRESVSVFKFFSSIKPCNSKTSVSDDGQTGSDLDDICNLAPLELN